MLLSCVFSGFFFCLQLFSGSPLSSIDGVEFEYEKVKEREYDDFRRIKTAKGKE